MRRESSTVIACVGEVSEPLLADLARSPNIALVRPPEGDEDRLASAAAALAEAGRRAATYVLVTADPLAGVAAQWRAMWDLSAGPGAATAFEEQAALALSGWRARQFELPDYYLVVTPAVPAPHSRARHAPAPQPSAPHVSAPHVSAPHVSTPRTATPRTSASRASATRASATPSPAVPDLYLGPFRAVRPRRVEAVVTGAGDAEAARVLQALRALPHGPWWPPLDELLDTARHFYAGSLGGTGLQPSG